MHITYIDIVCLKKWLKKKKSSPDLGRSKDTI